MHNLRVLLFLLLVSLTGRGQSFVSPDQQISVQVRSENGTLYYTVNHRKAVVLEKSVLGLVRDDADFADKLTIAGIDKPTVVTDSYTSRNAKKSQISYRANRYVVHCRNATAQPMDIIFQVSNDGVAFRYFFPETSTDRKRITDEKTSFNFASSTVAWLQPMSDAQTGWEHCNPAYEEFYQKEIPVGQPSPIKAGWVYPALFKTASDSYAALTEAGLDGHYCGTRLRAESPGGEYTVGFPQKPEVFTNGVLYPESTLPWHSPWRIIAVGSLKTIAESTLGTDLAQPAIALNSTNWIKPGIASWSWGLLKDESINYDTTRLYIDYASRMKWPYCMVDVNWDTRIGYDRIGELARYATTKNVALILWYNSAGAWNTTPYHPRSQLLTAEERRKEFRRIKDLGIAGVKIDFFAGDGQSMIQYYLDILKDAADVGLLVNFHGATLPRGWQRTYPHLMSAEAVKGQEMITFGQEAANEEPRHTATLPFTRNLFDPMDFTPMVLDSMPKISRVTTKGFELALPVLFLSGIQHLVETPDGMAKQPGEVVAYLQNIPANWDEVRFLDGYPGTFVTLARRSGKRWYVCGINAERTARSVTLDLSFLNGRTGFILEDVAHNQVVQKSMTGSAKQMVTMQPQGGFVAVFE